MINPNIALSKLEILIFDSYQLSTLRYRYWMNGILILILILIIIIVCR